MKAQPELDWLHNCFIAGGCILSLATRTDINDYDVYPKSKQNIADIIRDCLENNCFVVNISDRAVTFKCNDILNAKGERAIIQVMTYDDFETAQKIFDNFDFTVCMGAYDCGSKSYTFHEDFYPDIASKTLRFNVGTRYPLNSLLRVNKYHSKGFFISKPELVKMALTIAKAGMPDSWEEIEKQIGGTYGREIELLTKDMEFSFENAISLLGGMSHGFEGYETQSNDAYKWLTVDVADALFSGKEIKYVDMSGIDQINIFGQSNKWVVSEDGLLSFELPDLSKYPFSLNLVPYEGRLHGYKSVKPDGENKFKPLHNPNKSIRYSFGEYSEEKNSPHIFVYRALPIDKFNKIIRVSFDKSDIRSINSSELTATKLFVEEVL